MSANGLLRRDELVFVQGSLQLEPRTAAAYLAWKTAAAAAGYQMSILEPAGAFRPRSMQADMLVRPWLYNLGSKVLAKPGFSRHGFGRAVDLRNLSGWYRTWCLRTASDHGFHLWDASDPNHFEHGNALAQAAPIPASPAPPTPLPPEPADQEVTMIPLQIIDGRGLLGPAGLAHFYVFGPGVFFENTGQAANAVSVALIGDRDTPNLTYAELAQYAKASGAKVDPTLLAKITTAAT